MMSLLRISKFAEVQGGRAKASHSLPYRIYKKAFMNGPIEIEFPVEEEEEEEEESKDEKKEDDGKGGYTFLMWYSLDPDGAKLLSCGGLEMEISKND